MTGLCFLPCFLWQDFSPFLTPTVTPTHLSHLPPTALPGEALSDDHPLPQSISVLGASYYSTIRIVVPFGNPNICLSPLDLSSLRAKYLVCIQYICMNTSSLSYLIFFMRKLSLNAVS
jgi:hypothetical protein